MVLGGRQLGLIVSFNLEGEVLCGIPTFGLHVWLEVSWDLAVCFEWHTHRTHKGRSHGRVRGSHAWKQTV